MFRLVPRPRHHPGSILSSWRPAVSRGDPVIPAHGTLTLTPLGDDLVLQQPSPYESRATVPLTLTFRQSGTVTIDAPVTGPGTP